ncbi:isochorismate-pyruvate lyase [Chroococcidiopsis sp. CCALA 051]|uniref:isochorismate lyase n=1 Tax=Chroococcidiopsis sp. CCALA 051 TaxID=869949 RepID=UPI000D0E22F1|nr:isochorismate lyase [Chroococcidiopsis sp. CCALA 051]PSM51061.1 isochorismate-pyruvate lyase [Chroococcidiopsis sp. CCALA 051]
MKVPEECLNIHAIRQEIDAIDRQVIELLGQRFNYVKAAAQFKKDADGVKAIDRLNAMLQQRRIWAEEAELNPDAIEKIYRDLVGYFIEEELKHWESK